MVVAVVVVDDLQTLCTSTLRRLYAPSAATATGSEDEGGPGDDFDGDGDYGDSDSDSDDDDQDDGDRERTTTSSSSAAATMAAAAQRSSSSLPMPDRSLTPPLPPPPLPTTPPIDNRVIDAFFDSLTRKDRPCLQVESAWALAAVNDRLNPDHQQGVQDEAIPLLISLLASKDCTAATKARKVMTGLIPGDCDILRNLDLTPFIEAVMGDNLVQQVEFTSQLAELMSIDENFPEFMHRIEGTGILPRVIGFLRREDDHPDLPKAAMSILADLVSFENVGATLALVDANDDEHDFIPSVVHVLRSANSDVETKVLAASWIADVSTNFSPARRDSILRSGAVPLLDNLAQSPGDNVDGDDDPGRGETATRVLRTLCQDDPPPDLELLRPAVPVLARLIRSPDEDVADNSCWAYWMLLQSYEEHVIEPVIDAGACPRLIELLQHPEMQVPALGILQGMVRAGTERQLRAIYDQQLLRSLPSLLSSSDSLLRSMSCRILAVLSSDSQERIQHMIDQDIIPPLLKCLVDEDVEVREDAARTVGNNIMSHGTPGQVRRLVEDGCLPPLCNLLADDEVGADTILDALEGIEEALLADEHGSNDAKPAGTNTTTTWAATRIASTSDGVAKIRALTRHDDDDIRIRATRILTTYFSTNFPWDGSASNSSRRPKRRRESTGHSSS